MHYKIYFSCVSHIGCRRSMNQDNFICCGRYLGDDDGGIEFPISGVKDSREISVFGIFDGLGGEECGEIASLIAARDAAGMEMGPDVISGLSRFCQKANADICHYAQQHHISAMGTTAAVLVFSPDGVSLCNIGDSRIFRFSEGELEQISKDHVSVAVFGRKPPLSQNLGISPDELVIEPYFAQGDYHDRDIYLICSDGLTDMVSEDEIAAALAAGSVDAISGGLLDKALRNGGRDNISMILCRIRRKPLRFMGKKKWERKACADGGSIKDGKWQH